jgi:predicted aspartyl protease
VPVQIARGAPHEFVLDTGAEGTALYTRFAGELGLQPIAGKSEKLVGQTGDTTVPIVRLAELSVDGRSMPVIEAAVLPDRADGVPLAGILGADVLAGWLVDIDFRKHRVALHDPAADPRSLLGPGSFSLEVSLDAARFMIFPVAIRGTVATAVLDTGARKTRINWRLAGQLGIRPDSPGIDDAETIRGATNNPVTTKTGVIGAVTMGAFTVPDARVLIVDLPVFESFGIAGVPAMILGLDLLQNVRLLIDYRGARLWIEPCCP